VIRRPYVVIVHRKNHVLIYHFWTSRKALNFVRWHLDKVLSSYGSNPIERDSAIWYRLYRRYRNSNIWHPVESWGGYNYLNDVVAGMPSGMEQKR
jgi:hypothetical protein